MNISESQVEGATVLKVGNARIDAASASEFRQSLATVVGRGVSRFVIDLSGVSFIDSTGLGALVSALKAVGRSGCVVVSGAQEPVATLFKITRMDKVFQMFPSNREAAVALSSAAG
jgi:anti-sigma B factor antagonist